MRMTQELYRWLEGPHRTHTPIDSMKWNCKTGTSIGFDEVPEWQDWTERETTKDQQRIEQVIDGLDLSGKRLLHVGVGNSKLALRFCNKVDAIDGITIQKRELENAINMNISRYQVFLVSKFSSKLPELLDSSYDYIIDNNPSAFACCRMHFFVMMRNYRRLISPGGMILTDKLGLGWSTSENDPRWKLSRDDWYTIGLKFDFQSVDLTDSVYGLRAPI